MSNPAQEIPFGEVLEAVERLSAEEQEDLAAILRRRLAERGRKRMAQDVTEAREEFRRGECRRSTPDELIGEVLS
jgi:hypothetical protein